MSRSALLDSAVVTLLKSHHEICDGLLSEACISSLQSVMYHKMHYVYRLATGSSEFLDPSIHVKQADTDLCSDEQDNHILQEVRFPILNDLQEVLQVVLDKVKLHRTHTMSAECRVTSSSRARTSGRIALNCTLSTVTAFVLPSCAEADRQIQMTDKERTLSSSAS